jgi:glucokinase
MTNQFALGLDLGGTKIAAGVVNSRGRLFSNVRFATPAQGVRKDLAALFDAAHAAVSAAKIPWARIRTIGVGVPGAFDPRAETVWAPNLPGWKKVRLRHLLEAALRRPVYVESDRNVQALAEAWLGLGAQRQVRNLVFLTVGTGIGAGLISEGKLISGAHGVSGAAGWMVIDRSWEPEYGRMGCFEALGAGPAVARLGKKAWEQDPTSLMGALAQRGGAGFQIQDSKFQKPAARMMPRTKDLRAPRRNSPIVVQGLALHRGGAVAKAGSAGNITAEVVAAAARRGDKAARRVVEEVGANLGLGVANIVSLLNPEVVVLGGGLAGMGTLLLAPLRKALRQWGQPLARRQVRIVISRLGEEAGILGAARYALLQHAEQPLVARDSTE